MGVSEISVRRATNLGTGARIGVEEVVLRLSRLLAGLGVQTEGRYKGP